MKLHIGFLFILILFIIIYFIFSIINRNIKEYFIDTTGNIGDSGSNSDPPKCNLGKSCSLNGSYGICNNDGKCIIASSPSAASAAPAAPAAPVSPTDSSSPAPPVDPECLPNSTDFYAYCSNKDPSTGLKKITPCDSNTSKATCSNSINNPLNELTTPCLNKGDDFNEWCRYYSNYDYNTDKSSGYNVNSIGAKVVLVGKNGGCFVNGKSDETKAKAICSLNYIDEVTKLDPMNEYINYNAFTRCLPINNTDFVRECSNALKTDYLLSFANEIGSYDCNPGFARAKCIFGKDKYVFNNDFYKDSNNNNLLKKCTT
jgi:hypothetical protein